MITCPTPRDHETLRALWSYRQEHDRMPALRELMPLLGVGSVSTVSYRLERLEALGWIKRRQFKSRAITLTRRPA